MKRPSFPLYTDHSGFNALLPKRTACAQAEGDLAADHVVVGAGYTGLAAARRLAELQPQARIIVIEATEIGEGSSGRNSGFASPRDLPSGPSTGDLQHADALNRFTEEGWAWLMAPIEQHGIDCGLQRSGRIKAAATDLGLLQVRALETAVKAAGLPHEVWDRSALQERIGTSYYQSALYTEEGYLLDPAALIRGLADTLPANIALHENTPLLSMQRQGQWYLETPLARITAPSVIMATNAAIRHFGRLRDRLVTMYTYAALSDPLNAKDALHLGSMPVWGLLPSHRLGTTVRRFGPDRLLVRSMYAHERPVPAPRVQETLLSCFHRRYPGLAHIGLDQVWGGTTALTMNGAPWWGQVEEGLYTSAGCNGAGIVKGSILGKRLAELVLGHCKEAEVRATWGLANWVAPEPFRSIGFNFISVRERRLAGLEA
ncbi:MAG: FAD-binding oxidoreductase [Roseomonas sp.]|nr:FAD-binding oxidoreductase [Roseomonas sp.]